MLQTFKNGQTSIVLRTKLLDNTSTVGAGLTGLTSASSGLIIGTIASNEAASTAYTVAGSTIETITTLGTYAAPTATKCRFKEVDPTNHPGVYEFQFADARFAVSAAKSLLVSVLGATNLQQADFLVQLQVDDPYVAKITQGTGTDQISLSGGAVTVGTNNDKTGYALSASGLSAITAWTVNITGSLSGSVGSVTSPVTVGTNNDKTGYALSATGLNAITAWTVNITGNITGNLSGSVGSVTGSVGSVTAGVTVTTNSDKTGYTLSSSGLAAVTAWTVNITGNITGNLSGSVGSVTAPVTVGTNSDKTGYALTAAYDAAKTAAQAGDAMALTTSERNATADAFLNRDMSTGTDSGSTTVRTPRQAFRFLRNKFAIVTGTLTVYKEDDTTSSWTSTIVTSPGNPVSSSDPA